jgi:hypothetical protein
MIPTKGHALLVLGNVLLVQVILPIAILVPVFGYSHLLVLVHQIPSKVIILLMIAKVFLKINFDIEKLNII